MRIFRRIINVTVSSIMILNICGISFQTVVAAEPILQAQPVNVDIIFVMDTSGSMDDEFSALCLNIENLISELNALGVVVDYEILGITEIRECTFSTVADKVSNPSVDHEEDWGPAVRDLSPNYSWRPGATRLIIPMSDEGPQDGDPCEAPGPDETSIIDAISAANSNQVRVSPIVGSGYESCTADLAKQLSDGTGGKLFYSTTPAEDLAAGILELIGEVVADSDGDGIADEEDPYPADPCQPDPQAVCLQSQICGKTNTPHYDDDRDGNIDEEIQDSVDNDGDGLIDEDVGGVDCPFPDQDCGVNSHRNFDDDLDGSVDEENDDGLDDDFDKFVDEDVYCACPQEQDLDINNTPGVDDDHDFSKDEEIDDGLDNDGDGCIDEDIGSENITVSLALEGGELNNFFEMLGFVVGTDTVDAKLTILSINGGEYIVSTKFIDINGTENIPPDQKISLSPGKSNELKFSLILTEDSELWNYDIQVDVKNTATGDLVTSHFFEDIFFVTNSSNAELDNIYDCLDAEYTCLTALVGLIPFVGIPAQGVALADSICTGVERDLMGDPIGREIAAIRVVLDVVAIFGELLHIIPVLGTLGNFALDAAVGLIDCAEQSIYEFVVRSCGPKGYTCVVETFFGYVASLFPNRTTILFIYPHEPEQVYNLQSPLQSSIIPISLSDQELSVINNFIVDLKGTNDKKENCFEKQYQNIDITNLSQNNSSWITKAPPPEEILLSDPEGNFVEINENGEISWQGPGMIFEIGEGAYMAVLEGEG